MSTATLWITAAVVISGFSAVWMYGRREERVPGRRTPAVLRGVALFLLLAGPALPTLRRHPGVSSGRVVLLDISRSMALPVSAGASRSRLDSARSLLSILTPRRVILFGDVPASVPLGQALRAPATAGKSRLVPALEAARISGADSVWVLSDGAWDDRDMALESAQGLGLGFRELRTVIPEFRYGLAAVDAPEHMEAADTATVTVELLAGGGKRRSGGGRADSVTIELREGETLLARARAPVPDARHSATVKLRFVPGRQSAEMRAEAPLASDDSDTSWRVYEVVLLSRTDSLLATGRRRFVAEVRAEPGEAVLVSEDPGWEPHFLLPVLARTVLGGARGYLRLGEGGFVEMGANPKRVDVGRVRRAVASARLLVVQGHLEGFASWLEAATVNSHRKLLFPVTEGAVAGTPVVLGPWLSGEWYPSDPGPVGPAARLLASLPLHTLPPLAGLRAIEAPPAATGSVAAREPGHGSWIPLLGRRSRRGDARPLFVAGGRGGERWAVAAGEGYWRWALRPGFSRRAYEAVMTALIGWLLEDLSTRKVEMVGKPEWGIPLRWRIAPRTRNLSISVRDSMGLEIWSRRWDSNGEAVPELVEGSSPPPGLLSFLAEGRGPQGRFRYTRPFVVAEGADELRPRAVSAPLDVPAAHRIPGRSVGRGAPIWPFLAVVLILCAEWVWRRRIGLR